LRSYQELLINKSYFWAKNAELLRVVDIPLIGIWRRTPARAAGTDRALETYGSVRADICSIKVGNRTDGRMPKKKGF